MQFGLGILCLLLSFNGWAAEEQAKPSCGKRVLQYLSQSLNERLVQPVQQNVKATVSYQKNYWTEVRESKGKRLLTTGKNVAKKAAQMPYNQQMRYWTQIVGRCQQAKSFHGCIGNVVHRVVLVERENREKINLRQYLNPVNLYASPFTIGPEILRAKYNFSAPSQLILGMPAMIAVSMAYDHVLIHGDPFGIFPDMDDVAEEIPGVDYILGLYHNDLMETSFASDAAGFHTSTHARDVMNSHARALFDWVDHQGDAKYLDRVREFKDLGILSSDADVAELNRLAYQTYLSVEKKFRDKFPERLAKAWHENLSKHPKFSKLSPEDQTLLEMFFNPPVKISGHSDLELLARSFGKKVHSSATPDPLHALKGVAKSLSVPSTLKLAVATLENPKALVDKQKRWSKVLPNDDLPFLHRTDLPSLEVWGDVTFDQNGTGKASQVLKDELSYWELAFKDPRFLDIGEAYRSGDIDDMEALGDIFQRISALNELYSESRLKPKANVAKLCLWLDGEMKGSNDLVLPNVLISKPVSYFLDLITKPQKGLPEPRKLSFEQEEGCRIDVAEYLYDSDIRQVKVIRGEVAPIASKEFVQGLNRTLSLCPLQSPPRSCL